MREKKQKKTLRSSVEILEIDETVGARLEWRVSFRSTPFSPVKHTPCIDTLLEFSSSPSTMNAEDERWNDRRGLFHCGSIFLKFQKRVEDLVSRQLRYGP